MGEDLGKTSGKDLAIRSMSNPNEFKNPDTYKGDYWYTSSGDHGGVHTNSGVLNHWFYLLSVGGSGTNDLGWNYSVTGIGIEKAAKITYRNETVYLTSSSKYEDAKNGAIQAAVDLYGDGSAEVKATKDAWYAVGLGTCDDCPVSYCESKGSNTSYEYIDAVKFGSIDNKSGNNSGYKDYTSLSTAVTAGSSVTITLAPGFTKGTTYNEEFVVWIDFNQDADFDDAGEKVYSSGKVKKEVSGTITIPASALNGDTRMRVSMKYNSAPGACESFTYGEVEDYTVTVSGGTSVVGSDLSSAYIFPIPVENTLNLDFPGIELDQNVVIKDMQGNVKTSFVYGNAKNGVDISYLPRGIYLVAVEGSNIRKRLIKK